VALPIGDMTIYPLADNAARVRIAKEVPTQYQELVYTNSHKEPVYKTYARDGSVYVIMKKLKIVIDKTTGNIRYYSPDGKNILSEAGRAIQPSVVQNVKTYAVQQSFVSPQDEHLFGLGQFQDGFLDVRGLMRRLTQVNTQISIPFIVSNKGYALLWNNYGLTEFNPSEDKITLNKTSEGGAREEINVTTSEGGKKVIREQNQFTATLNIQHAGRYAILMDVCNKMAKKHYLEIDGKKVIDLNNYWLPPTSSAFVTLTAGRHELKAELTKDDAPVIYYKEVDDKTTFRSPVSDGLDYTIFAGTPEQTISTYRTLTGGTPMMPSWALGYIHCRERFHSQDEIITTAAKFRALNIPVDVMVQDWQYWGKYGWNAMRFDEQYYPNPALLTSKLHAMNMKLMLSVWAKMDDKCEVGRIMAENHYFIPNTTWIDFFNPKAAQTYWKYESSRLLQPSQIDAWWQDATEPENDDIAGRRIMNGTTPGEIYRNVFPLFVNKTVYEGCRKDDPSRRTMILTRCGFSGIQRYGVAMWSGDVGNDWDSFRRQLTGGLGLIASGMPWWTYDAGGFFRPDNQYADPLYHERMIRWLQAAAFLPLMRVHGFVTNTEFWNYGPKVTDMARNTIAWRYRLLPYIYSETAKVSFKGSMLTRPLIMDFASDKQALSQKYEFMFGPSMLIAPIVEESPKAWNVYLPDNTAGWYDYWNNSRYDGKQTVSVPVTMSSIPVFVKAGSILSLGDVKECVSKTLGGDYEIRIYPGADAVYTLYEDEGENYNYEKGRYATIPIRWKDSTRLLTIGDRNGSYAGMPAARKLKVTVLGRPVKNIMYKGKAITVNCGNLSK